MANWFSKTVKENRSILTDWQNPVLGTLRYNSSNSYTSSKALKISSVYRSVNLIADSVSILELIPYTVKGWKYKNIKGNKLYYLLNVAPNKLMNANTFKRLLVQYLLLNGNAYIRIKRKGAEIQNLYLVHPDDVDVMLNADGESLSYRIRSADKIIDSADMIHILNNVNPSNGLLGISTIEYGSLALGIAYSAEEMANNWFKSGGVLSGILKPTAGSKLVGKQGEEAKTKFMSALNADLGGSPNSIVVLDNGLEYQPIVLSNKDMQLLESRQWNIQAVSHYFGVPLALLDSSKSNYNTQEAAQISFLNSCLLPILEKIELAFYTKLFSEVEYDSTDLIFDVNNLLRLDASTQATVFNQLFGIGALTTNEIRDKLNCDYPVANGNRAMVQQNVQPLDNLLNDIKNKNNSDNNTDNNNQ